ncbi:MAG: M20 family metallopeptidase [Planctomycetes bacterium]|nr:M20 family metallopeptidase [Planctomycetota bacterium]
MTETNKINSQDRDLEVKLCTLTGDLIRIPTTSDRPDQIAQGLELIHKHAQQKGIHCQKHSSNGYPSLVFLPETITKPNILLVAHLDVVNLPESAQYNWHLNEGKIIGPGAGDMKGELAIILELFHDMHSRHQSLSLGLAITTDEELGGLDGIGYLVSQQGLAGDYILIPDSGSLNEITSEEKGVLQIRLTSKGQAGHAALPWLCQNAAQHLCDNIEKIHHHFDTFEKNNEHWHPTCELTVFVTTNVMHNRIPDQAQAVLDIRFPPPETAESMLNIIRKIVDEQLDLNTLLYIEPTKFQPDPQFMEITREITKQPVKTGRAHGSSDARYFHEMGAEVIMSRPFVGNLHTENEWIEIDSMLKLYRIYERFIEHKCLHNKD